MGAAKKESPVQVVKVSPFPIAVILQRGSPAPANPGTPAASGAKARIRSMNISGFVMDADYEFFRIGEVLMAQFELPVTKVQLSLKVQVVRTQQPIEHFRKGDMATRLTVEVRFMNLNVNQKGALHAFLSKISQKS